MSKTVLWVIVGVVTMFNFGITYSFVSFKKRSRQEINDLQSAVQGARQELEIIRNDFRYGVIKHVENDYTSASNTDLLTMDNVHISLKDAVQGRETLIYRITDFVCSVCYEDVIQQLDTFRQKNKSTNVMIIVPGKLLREMKEFLQKKHFNIPMYVAKSTNALGLKMENEDAPFLFLLNRDLTFRHFLVPPKSDINTTADYLATLQSRYFMR